MNARDDEARPQQPLAIDSDAGEPLEPGLESPSSAPADSGELDQPADGSMQPALPPAERSPLELRDPEAEPERDEVASQADPPTGNLIPPATPEQR